MWDDSPPEIHEVYERLVELHGELELIPRRTPMRELVLTMLSHRTTHKDEELAYERMMERFKTWEGVRDAPVEGLTDAIRTSRYPEAKARNIKETLSLLFEERGEANIDFLAEMSADEGMKWLTSLPGVGVKTATLVLLFNFHKPVLPVDTHVHRISLRVGLIPEKTSANKAHDSLLEMLPEDPYVLYNFHKALYRHGQRVCTYSRPRCERCPLTGLCDWYAQNRAE